MNNLILSQSHALTLSCSHVLSPLTLFLLLAVLPTKADTSFTAIGWRMATPSFSGITVTNNSTGQVYLKGNTHVVRIVSDDPRVTGRSEAWMDLAYQPDGTAIFSGPVYSEVGQWDPSGATFTPSGGVWALNYSGLIKADGSSQYSMAGYGIGGAIEGLRFSATMTRANSDLTTPYLGAGTIKPAPVNTRVVVDDFADNRFTWTDYNVGPQGSTMGTFFAHETNQQLTIGGTWSTPSGSMENAVAWADLNHSWALSADQTIEVRVDVIALSPKAAGAELGLWGLRGSNHAYFVLVGRNSIALAKCIGGYLAYFRCVQASIKDTNIVLSLALTLVDQNVVLTGKVLDKESGAVMAQVVATDTPAVDPTLSASELAAITGGRVWSGGIRTDPIGKPYTRGEVPWISVHQESDVAPVTAFATFDNLELRTYEVPPFCIESAVRVSWPKCGMNSIVEEASNPEGPYLPLQNLDLPDVQYFTVPANAPKRFFRLQPTP